MCVAPRTCTSRAFGCGPQVRALLHAEVVEAPLTSSTGCLILRSDSIGPQRAKLAQRVIHHLERDAAAQHVVGQLRVAHCETHREVVERASPVREAVDSPWPPAARSPSATVYGVVPQLAASTPVIARGSSPAQCSDRYPPSENPQR